MAPHSSCSSRTLPQQREKTNHHLGSISICRICLSYYPRTYIRFRHPTKSSTLPMPDGHNSPPPHKG